MKKSTVLVTGASRGIGFTIAEKLLESGFKVIGVGKSESISSTFVHENYSGISCDLSSKSDLEQKLKPLFESENCPDVLINNAGIAEPCSFDVSDQEWDIQWDRTLQVNLNTPVQLIKWAIPMWEKRKKGIHIVISSRAAYRGETEQYASYAASKSGIIGVSKTIARGFGERGITSFAVAPGFTMTDMLKEAIPVYGEDYMKRENVLGEIAPTDDVADLCVLLSQGKLKHMTGQTFHINSGSYML